MKAPIVEVLEERVMEVAEERSAAAAGSAAADDVDELRAPEAAVAAALGVLSRGVHIKPSISHLQHIADCSALI